MLSKVIPGTGSAALNGLPGSVTPDVAAGLGRCDAARRPRTQAIARP
jgi:hypothetical protein